MRAEDRFGWLDDEAAEDLLRGTAADGSSSCPPPHAEELASALDGLAESHQPAECAKELPGEAEALAAFRTARSRRCRGGAAGARSRRGRYMTRLSGTPLHVGLAMTLAGFALGGVAVAASNGVLPAPFGDDGGQGPGVSGGRPPAVEPLERDGGEQGDGSDSPTRRLPGGGSPSESGQSGGDGGSDRDYRDIAGVHRGNGDNLESERPSTDRPSTWPHKPRPDRDKESPDPGSWPPTPPSTKPDGPDHTVVVALCKAYEGDQIEQRKRRQLERVAGGPEQVERYCEEYGDVGGGGGGTEGGDGNSGGVGIPEQPGTPGTPEEPGGSDGGADGGGSGGSGGSGGASGGGSGGSGGGGAAGGAGGAEDEVSGGADSSGGTEGADNEGDSGGE